MRLQIKSTVLALALASLSLPAFPAGLGKLTVMSGLGQPLKAEVELTATREELSSLAARLAPAEAFKQAGIEFAPALAAIKFEVAKRTDGKPILKLSSDRPISEPFLDMLIQLDWAQGRLVREYTFLLDPPEAVFARQQVAPVAPPEGQTAAPAAKPAAPAKAEAAEPTKSPPAGDAAGTREVKRGDTLSRIASETKPDGVTLDQMLVALFRGNRGAFAGKNMNRLRAGAILSIPDADAAAAVTPREARKVVVAQAADFNAYRQRIAAAAAAAPADAATGQVATGKIAPQVEEKAPAAAAEPRDQLRVSKADAKAQKDAQQRIASLEEDIAAREKALKEANSRLGDLEKNVGDLQKLVELKNQQLADLQKQAAAGKAPAPAAAKPEPVPAAQPQPAAPAAPASAPVVAEKPATEPSPAAPAPAAEAVKPGAPAEPSPAPAVETPKPVPAPAQPKPTPAEEPGFLASLTENPLALYGGAGALAALLGLLAYRMRQGRKEEAPPPSTVGKMAAQSVFGATGGQSVDTSASSIQTDFSHSGMTAIDADEGVDPVAEADVYMAYGRDAQAEEILLDALKNEPTRHAIHVKLLEIYAQRKSQKQFETLASELYAQTGGVGAEWEKAAAMGRKLDPANPLYGSRAAPEAPSAAAPAAGLAAVAAAAATAGVAATAEPPQQFKDTWTMPGEVKAAAESSGDETTVAMPRASATSDGEVGSFGMELPPVENLAPPTAATPSTDAAGLDFDLGLDFSASDASPTPEVVRTGILEPGIAERTEAAAAFATEAAEAERANRSEAFAGTESLVARSVIDFDLGDAAEPADRVAGSAPKPDVPVMDLERTDVAGTLIDFNLDELTGSKPSGDVAVMDLERTDVGGNLLDFNFELAEGKQAPVPESVPTLDLSGIDLDLPSADASAEAAAGAGGDGENPEVATKLELAKAYEEMGDREGARELLDEVLAEGSLTQKDLARDILARLG